MGGVYVFKAILSRKRQHSNIQCNPTDGANLHSAPNLDLAPVSDSRETLSKARQLKHSVQSPHVQ